MEAMKMNIDGTIRAKVLQYKQDGNTLTEKWETLKKLGDGVYYRTENEYGYNTAYFIFESDGFFFDINVSDKEDRIEHHRQEIMMYRNEFEGKILSRAEKLDYINLLEIEVMRRLGHDTDPLIASRNAYIKRREEEERKAAEDKARREQDRKEADERRKAELLADGKEKIIANKAVTVEQIELLAEAVIYKIHIRTIGFMREKVSEAVLNADETVTVWGSKLTSRNISGTADVLREIAARIKAQTEVDAQQPDTDAETPQIPTETAETGNVSAECEKREIKHISSIMETCRIVATCCCSPGGTHTYTDEWNYYNWLRNAETIGYQTIADKALTEAWTNIFLAAYRRGSGHILAMNKCGELVDTIFVSPTPEPIEKLERLPQQPKSAPQSRKTLPTVNYAATRRKRLQRANKRPNSVILRFRATRTILRTSAKCSPANPPP